MKNILRLNILVSVIIIVTAVLDLLFWLVLGYPDIFLLIFPIIAIASIAIGGLIGLALKKNDVKFPENAISERIGFKYFNDFSTLFAGIGLLASFFLVGYVNALAIGGALYSIIMSLGYLKEN